MALHADEETTPEAELVEDLLAIVMFFAGRLYGLRSGKGKEVVVCVKKATQSASELDRHAPAAGEHVCARGELACLHADADLASDREPMALPG